jgi:transposase
VLGVDAKSASNPYSSILARRAELFVRELSDGEVTHVLKLVRHRKNSTVQHRAMLLFASFQGESVSRIALLHRASATHVAEFIHAFNLEGFAALDPRPGGSRPSRIDPEQRGGIVKVALACPVDLGEPFTSWSLSKLRAHLVGRQVVVELRALEGEEATAGPVCLNFRFLGELRDSVAVEGERPNGRPAAPR